MVLGIINSSVNSSTKSLSMASSQSSTHFLGDNFSFKIQDVHVLHRFHARTILTLVPANAREAHQQIYSKLMHSSLPLLHTILTLTYQHDQYLGIGLHADNAAAIAFHWSQAAALLNQQLSAGVKPKERDALWACAALLGALAFAAVDVSRPEDVWPLNPASNLGWLRLTEGKKEIMRLTDPMREDSIFQLTMSHFSQYASPNLATMAELRRLPSSLFRLCKLDDTTLHSGHPYYGPASMLAQTQDLVCTSENVGRFLSFFGSTGLDFLQLLHQKDPCAMILLGYWYAKMCQCQRWYTWRRSYLESQAICKYLQKNYRNADVLDATQDIQTKCAAEQPWAPISQSYAQLRTIRPLAS